MKNKKSLPLVSVVMPAYNAESFIVESIESILTQTYTNFELIIVNDASTDSTKQIINSYQKKYPSKIKCIHLKRNLNGGGDRCANKGVELAQGKYIARMDADDIARKDRLKKQVDFLENNPEITLVGSNATVIDSNGIKIGTKVEPASHEDIYNSYFTFHPMIHPTCMIRTRIDGKKFSYRLGYSANNDYFTFFTLLCQGHKFANIQEELIKFRIHGRNDTFVKMKKKYANTLDIRLRMIKEEGYHPTPKGIAATVAQTIVIHSLPESTLTKLYLVTKGIEKPTIFLPSLSLPSLSLSHIN